MQSCFVNPNGLTVSTEILNWHLWSENSLKWNRNVWSCAWYERCDLKWIQYLNIMHILRWLGACSLQILEGTSTFNPFCKDGVDVCGVGCPIVDSLWIDRYTISCFDKTLANLVCDKKWANMTSVQKKDMWYGCGHVCFKSIHHLAIEPSENLTSWYRILWMIFMWMKPPSYNYCNNLGEFIAFLKTFLNHVW